MFRFERLKIFDKHNESSISIRKNVLTFGFLTHMRYPQVLGAITLAVDSINRESTILPNTKLEFKFEHLSRELNRINENNFKVQMFLL